MSVSQWAVGLAFWLATPLYGRPVQVPEIGGRAH